MKTIEDVTTTTDVIMTKENFSCIPAEDAIKQFFTFSSLSLVRVICTWFLFLLSLTGNLFVIWALCCNKGRHRIMFNLALSNLVFTIFVMPVDAIWHTTMEWMGGDVMCRLTQMMKQYGMYASSFMVVVIAVDRVTAILCTPMHPEGQKKRGTIMVRAAWCIALLCSAPALILYSAETLPICEDVKIYQCVNSEYMGNKQMHAYYYLFTMFLSFVVPLLSTLVAFSLILCEISNMKERDQVLMERRHSVNSTSMDKAKRRAIIMRSVITAAFFICWGPYYGKGLYDWFAKNIDYTPTPASTIMYMAMYLNPVLHPLVFGMFMKDVRKKFYLVTSRFRDWIIKRNKHSSTPQRNSVSSYTTAVSNAQNSKTSYHIKNEHQGYKMIPIRFTLLDNKSPV